MILTLTPNAALDRILFIDEFKPGTVMRPERILDRVGGKGLDSSVALRAFGVDTLALSFVAGDAGRRLAGLLNGYGIRHDLIWLAGETRIAHVVVETRRRRHSHIIAGALPVPPEAAVAFLERFRVHVSRAGWVIAAGTLPPGVPRAYYRRMVEIARQAGVPILIDSSGPPVQAVLAAPPTVLKMNWQEFNQTFNVSTGSLEHLVTAARAVAAREHLQALVITCGRRGILAFTPDGDFQAAGPPQEEVNAAGAGDAASGVLAWKLSLGATWPEALRWAAATSAAVVLTEGTADCNRADVDRLLPHITVKNLA